MSGFFLFFSALILFLVATGWWASSASEKFTEHSKEIYMVRMPGIDCLIESDRDLQQEFLVSERSIMFTDLSSPLFKEFLTDHATNMKQSLERWEKYRNLKKLKRSKGLFPAFGRPGKMGESHSRLFHRQSAYLTRFKRLLPSASEMLNLILYIEGGLYRCYWYQSGACGYSQQGSPVHLQ